MGFLTKFRSLRLFNNIPVDCELRKIYEWKPQSRPRLFSATELLIELNHQDVVNLASQFSVSMMH